MNWNTNVYWWDDIYTDSSSALRSRMGRIGMKPYGMRPVAKAMAALDFQRIVNYEDAAYLKDKGVRVDCGHITWVGYVNDSSS